MCVCIRARVCVHVWVTLCAWAPPPPLCPLQAHTLGFWKASMVWNEGGFVEATFQVQGLPAISYGDAVQKLDVGAPFFYTCTTFEPPCTSFVLHLHYIFTTLLLHLHYTTGQGFSIYGFRARVRDTT